MKENKSLILFVATTQENSSYIEFVSKEFKDAIVLHPFYSFTTELGKEVFNRLPNNKQLSLDSDNWEYIAKKDLFCISQADIVLYDLDNLPPEGRYLVMSATIDKPILGISGTLKSVSAYFSGSVMGIVKPEQTLPFVKMYLKTRESEKEKTEKIERKEKKERKEKSSASMGDRFEDGSTIDELIPRDARKKSKSKTVKSIASVEPKSTLETKSEDTDIFNEVDGVDGFNKDIMEESLRIDKNHKPVF